MFIKVSTTGNVRPIYVSILCKGIKTSWVSDITRKTYQFYNF
jgi:hypothetical protein